MDSTTEGLQTDLTKAMRAHLKNQVPRCIWFTGLSGSGKTTIANLLEEQLYGLGLHTYVLDGDRVRQGLNCDLGFSDADRLENTRRASEVARLMVDAGLIVIVSFISPSRSGREEARARFAPGEFLEVFVDTPFEECLKRDVKGLYAKAMRGEIKSFTGLDSAYEAPTQPDIRIQTIGRTAQACVNQLMLTTRGLFQLA